MFGWGKNSRAWNITHEGAKLSEPVYEIGRSATMGMWASQAQKEELLPVCQFLFGLRESFDQYFDRNDNTHFENAVKYLVFMAALSQGMDGDPFDFRAIRNFSQGLYSAMKDKRAEFQRTNLPVFDELQTAVQRLM